MKKIFKFCLIGILVFTMMIQFQGVRIIHAVDVIYSDAERIIVDKMESVGISKEKQISLIKKIRSGQLPDSVTGEVEVTPIVVNKINGDCEFKYFYPDGSFAVTTISKHSIGGTSLFNVDGGNLNTGNGHGGWWERKNMRIYHDFLFGSIGFYANASGTPNVAKITKVFDEWARAYIGASFSIPTLIKESDNHAVLKVNITSFGGLSSRYMKLHLYIYGMNNYYSEYKG